MDKGNSFSFSHWNLALTFLPFVFRIDMHTHFAAPQKRGYTHTLGLAPLPREPIDTSISNMGFLCTSTWWQLCYGRESSPGEIGWKLDGGSVGGNGEYTPLPNVRPGFKNPPKKKNPNLTGLRQVLTLCWKSREFVGGKFLAIFCWDTIYRFDFQKKFQIRPLFSSRGLQVLQWQLLEISHLQHFHHFFLPELQICEFTIIWNRYFTTDFGPGKMSKSGTFFCWQITRKNLKTLVAPTYKFISRVEKKTPLIIISYRGSLITHNSICN